MVDRDIIMLQLAAANMPSDDFLINVVSKFQLIPWSSEEFDLKEDDRQVLLLCHKIIDLISDVNSSLFLDR